MYLEEMIIYSKCGDKNQICNNLQDNEFRMVPGSHQSRKLDC